MELENEDVFRLVLAELVFRLGGQVTLSIDDLLRHSRECRAVRNAFDESTRVWTLTYLLNAERRG